MSEFNYLEERQRYLNSIGRTDGKCNKVSCTSCMLSCYNNGLEIMCGVFEGEYPDLATETVRKWSEAHPLISNADKFIEIVEDTFGITFDKEDFIAECPLGQLFKDECPKNSGGCSKCKEWWAEEYKEPKRV